MFRRRTGHCRLNSHLERIGVRPQLNAPVKKRTRHQNITCNPAHSTTKQGSRYGPLLCPSKPSSGGLQRICSWHPSMQHSLERGSSQRNHHIERRRRRSWPCLCYSQCPFVHVIPWRIQHKPGHTPPAATTPTDHQLRLRTGHCRLNSRLIMLFPAAPQCCLSIDALVFQLISRPFSALQSERNDG